MMEWAGVAFAVVILVASAFRFFRLVQRSDTVDIDVRIRDLDQDRDATLNRYLQILGLRLEPLVFAAGLCLIAVTISLLFLTIFEDEVGFSIAAGLTFFPLAFYVLKDLVAWRAEEFEWHLVDALDLSASLSASGVSAVNAIEAGAQGASPTVKTELDYLVLRLKLGDSIEGATGRLLSRYRSEGVRLFVNLLRSRWNGGANFDLLLGALAKVLRERRSFARQSRGQLSGAKYALLFAAIFPYLLIPFFQSQEPEWLAPITTHAAGPSVLYMAIFLQVFGLLWTRAILRSKSW
ncbi:type II secretion system F family protein [Marinobacter hydrocarbonoclasticus]|uniref:type II secretion system F family protein n=1 Tax=Marinobacter nauticus TaxID=2743 RepID=UPI001C96978F|nr:type II secretion system F family protein [Marinobacter nauticus]MBY6194589.1 type II secretion system F family protein [Marinobacter nauticus]MBY6215737.1 type II secretion system F family protein [Marinobacter nauticus]